VEPGRDTILTEHDRLVLIAYKRVDLVGSLAWEPAAN
jgi:hypothetical protein